VGIRGIVSLGCLGAVGSAATVARAEAAAPPSKVFVGPEGLTAAVVPLPPPAINQVLIQVSGSGTVFDGKAIAHGVDTVDVGKTDFETTYHGRAWNTLVLRGGDYTMNLPGRRGDLRVVFDEKRTASLKPDAILAAYQKQKNDGTLQTLAAFDRKAEVAQQEKAMQEIVDGFDKSCGAKPAIKIDWSSLSDADIQEISIASFCGEPLDTMRRMCEESKEAKTTIAGKVKAFSCSLGKTLQMELAGSTLKWTTSRSGTNLGEFARKYLEKAL
jgi:hypothetical protein